MIILGIDPAIRVTGYGIVKLENGIFSALDCGVIKNSVTMPHTQCLKRLSGGIRELASTFSPDVASLEEPFLGKNASTAIILGMARGAILAALAERDIPCYAYSPRRAKKTAVGNGGASKEQVALMMAAQLRIDVGHIPLDATDALALAMCHGQLAAGGSGIVELLTRPI